MEISPFSFGVTTLEGELAGRGVMNPKSNQKLLLQVGAESYVTIIPERIFSASMMYVTH